MKSVLLLLMSFLLASCASIAPVPEDNYYRLSDIAGDKSSKGRALSGVLAIGVIENAGIYNERAVLYSAADASSKLQRYHYHFWADTPPRLIQDHLTLYLRQSGVAKTVVADRGELDWNYLLVGKLRRFERIMTGSGSRVAVEIEMRLLNRWNRKALLVKDYATEVEVSGDTVNDAVESFSKALGTLYGQLVTDIKRVAK